MRTAYAESVVELAKMDDKIVFISSDCGGEERRWFYENAGQRLIETGIAEANAISLAAGLASEGFRPYQLNFGYLLGRMYNQISQSIAEDKYRVSIAGYYCGVMGTGGRSHNCVTDLALMRALPNFIIYAPADYWETKTVVRQTYKTDGPNYTRLAGVKTPSVYSSEPEFAPLRVLEEGADCTIICHGTMVRESLEARRTGKLNCAVVDLIQIKPLPARELLHEVRKTGRVIIAEDHSVIGGAAEAVSSFLCEAYPVPMRKICAPDAFPLSVKLEEPNPYGKYGISAQDIIAAVKNLMSIRTS